MSAMPQGDPGLGGAWPILTSASLTLGYVSMLIALGVIVRRRPDLLPRPTAWMLAILILLGGASRILELPGLGAGHATRDTAALLFAAAAMALWFLVPRILALPSSARLVEAYGALEETNGQLKLAEQIAGVGHWRLSLPDRELRWSAELFRIFGLDPAGPVPDFDAVLEAYHPDDRRQVRRDLERAISHGQEYACRSRVVRTDGQIRYVQSRGVPEHGPDGSLVALFGVFMDMTEHRAGEEMRAELRSLGVRARAAMDASRAKTNFLANMSHELRTPLNGLLGHAQLLRQDRGLGPEPSARVEVMVETGAHLMQVINRVLDLSEIENGHLEMKTAPTDLRSLADACFDLILPAAGTKQLTLRLTVAPDVPARVIADGTRLRQVLDTLLRNAVRFSAQGAVELRLRRPADNAGSLRFEVVDSGPGLSADQRRRLYHDFDRLDAAALTSIEGVGLGLSIASRLVALMGGRLGHDDNPEGGSVFWVELPLRADAPEAAIKVQPDDSNARALPPLRLLVVDDVAMNRDIAEAFLLAAGHQVACASSGMEAVLAVAAADFDAVLMDVRMPGMDGLEAARRIRAVPGPRGQVPLIALTAQAFSDQVAECREAGMQIHLAKPITQAALADALRRAIDRSAALPQIAAA